MTGTRTASGGSTMASSGSSAPMVKAAIDAQAACHGLVRSFGSMPQLGLGVRREGVVRSQLRGHLEREVSGVSPLSR